MRATVVVGGTVGMLASAALADEGWKAPPPEGYPSGWNVKAVPTPQAYDYAVGTGSTNLRATGNAAPPAPDQNAHVIYQMVPGGLRYHRMTQ